MSNIEIFKGVDKKIDIEEQKKVGDYRKEKLEKALLELLKEFNFTGGNNNQSEGFDKEEKFSPEMKALIDLRRENVMKSMRDLSSLREKSVIIDIFHHSFEKIIRNMMKKVVSTRNEATDILTIEKTSEEIEKRTIEQRNPESFVVSKLVELKDNIKRLHDGGIVETPYVKEMKSWLKERIRLADPVFLHGHLGAGKTETALDASRDFLKRKYIEDRIFPIILKIVKEKLKNGKKDINNISPRDKEIIVSMYRKVEKELNKKLAEGDEEVTRAVTPYLIVGSKDFSLEDLYVEKTLQVKKFNGKTMQEHHQNIQKFVDEWKKKHEEELATLSPEDRNAKINNASQQILEIYRMKHEGFGTEVKKIEKELYKAVQEGKPIIIDEANAIPPSVFVSMNDILTKRPGDVVQIPGVGPVKVKDGFSVIMTGNLETEASQANYVGTNKMNTAFRSRFFIREYNYLPQSTEGTLIDQENLEKNELFYVISTYLMNRDASLVIPKDSLQKLFGLAQLARVSQDVFAGKWKESQVETTVSGDMKEPEIKEAVMSPRALIRILKDWNKGQTKDLDKALWDSYMSGIIDAEDQHYMLQQAKRFGFFTESDAWLIEAQEEGKPLLTFDDVRTRPYSYDLRSVEDKKYSPRDVVEILYGKAPDRLEYPDISLEAIANTPLDPEELIEKKVEFEVFEKLVERYTLGMDTLSCENNV